MAGVDWTRVPDDADAGRQMHDLMAELYPICRSISGEGLRETLRRVSGVVPLELTEVPTGTAVFDWTVPNEWNIREAWIEGPEGRRVIDFADSNLHVLNYSAPVRTRLPLAELRSHLYSDPDRPDVIPYRTSYYEEKWGFCLSDSLLESLPDGEYEAVIDSTLEPGSLTYGEALVPGAEENEVLLSTYCCHPSLATTTSRVSSSSRCSARCSRRWSAGTAIACSSAPARSARSRGSPQRGARRRIRHGLVVSCVGDPRRVHVQAKQARERRDRRGGRQRPP